VEDPLPTYQYACTECGHAFEQFQSFSDDSLTTCPVCEGRLRKVFNAVGVVFKGSGFYRTDSRTAGANGASSSTPTGTGGGSGAGSGGEGTSGGSTSGETKAAPKADKAGTGSTSGSASGSTSAA
jgi:putative FmdB family regulatory protein